MHQPPTEETARTVARAALGDAARPPRSRTAAGALTEGPDVRPVDGRFTWWVGTGHVLRLAPDPDASVRLRREVRLRDLVRSHTEVSLPISAAAGTWAAGLAYTLDTRLPGEAPGEGAVSAAGESDLADLLAGLGTVPVAQASALGLHPVAARFLERLGAEAGAAVERLVAAGEFAPGRFTLPTRRGLAQLAARPGGVLVHRALESRHLRVSGQGRVSGVLGWSRAALGDPAEDVATLAAALGAPVAVRAATLAGHGPRECLRGLWLARCDTVLHLAAALLGPAAARSAAHGPAQSWSRVRLAWEPILLERHGGAGAPGRGENDGDVTPPW